MVVVAIIRILFPRPDLDQHSHSFLNQFCFCCYCAGGNDGSQSPTVLGTLPALLTDGVAVLVIVTFLVDSMLSLMVRRLLVYGFFHCCWFG